MPEFYTIITRKIFSRLFFVGGGHVPPSPSSTPMMAPKSELTGLKSWKVIQEKVYQWLTFLGHSVESPGAIQSTFTDYWTVYRAFKTHPRFSFFIR